MTINLKYLQNMLKKFVFVDCIRFDKWGDFFFQSENTLYFTMVRKILRNDNQSRSP